MDIVWEDPPEKEIMTWKRRLLPLMECPGTWARVAEMKSAHVAASDLRLGRTPTPIGRWEFRSATVGGKHYVYARYLGEGDDAKH